MNYVATITSKRQFTIPSDAFKKANYKPQQKLLLTLTNSDSGVFTIRPMENLVEELAGSVPISPQYKNLSLNEMVEKARRDYYKTQK